eukprot:CAMPEP_0203665078 /NCGR_PEP_ID=MMETSP0090-20130426/2357_1 /ASSEMBLY_ACC=CAM_ASM_001088 /TAXON_ID=426623 /ORGANISM="Chaetoceros affinis, Strain CCMP159" /LENGTH=394 /DNA_ID=CAMNT_0050528521 /DNA_START=131 /DNA_END=1315 /DNA_ORIENTATION=+
MNHNNSTGGNGGTSPSHSSSSSGVHHDMAKIFVGGLSWQTTEETLRYHFELYGEVVSVEVMRDRNTGDPRGFAFVVFKEDSTVEAVMNNLPHEINHKVVDVKRAQARGMAPPSIHRDGTGGGAGSNSSGTSQNNPSRGDRNSYYGKHDSNNNSNINSNDTSSVSGGGGGGRHRSGSYSKGDQLSPEQLQNKIFVGGLPLHLNKDELRDFFSQFGTVVDAIIMMDMHQQRSRGFGFVTFENGSGGAQAALKAQPLYIGEKYVEIKLATPKGDRDQQQQHGGGGGNKSKYHQNSMHAPTGLRNAAAASMAYQSKGEFAGLAASYGRSGWRAGYGTIAFGSSGWNVKGWEDISKAPEHSGFSFELVENAKLRKEGGRNKRDAVKGVEQKETKRQRRS